MQGNERLISSYVRINTHPITKRYSRTCWAKCADGSRARADPKAPGIIMMEETKTSHLLRCTDSRWLEIRPAKRREESNTDNVKKDASPR